MHRTVTEKVQAQLRELILSGSLLPNSRIDQGELAQRFGVSLVPVREALARLQSSGLVRIVPHRGVFIAPLSAEELIDIYQMREMLEEQAARLAAAHLSDTDLHTLDELLQRQEALAERGDFVAFLESNRELHFTIYRASGRQYLLQIITQLWDQSTRYRLLQLHVLPDRARESLFETRAIIAACHRRDPEALGTMVRYKVHQTTVDLLAKIDVTATSMHSEVRQLSS